jgi:deoxycytidine triphosphate deaminase
VCAVLADGEIRKRSEGVDAPLIFGFDEGGLRPAGYDLRIAGEGLATPDKQIAPGATPDPSVIILAPGEMAELTSFEHVRLPHDVAGNLALKTRYARKGLLLLSGLLIDPSYGCDRPKGARLHFYVANLGDERITIKPEKDKVVALQFFETCGERDPRRRESVTEPEGLGHTRSELGFIERLKRVSDVHAKLERQERATEWVIVATIFVLAAAVVSVMLQSVLQVLSDEDARRAITAATPDRTEDRWFIAAVVLGAAWALFALALLARSAPSLTTLKIDRVLPMATTLLVAIPAIGFGIDYLLGAEWDDGLWPVWATLVCGSLLAAIWLARGVRSFLAARASG